MSVPSSFTPWGAASFPTWSHRPPLPPRSRVRHTGARALGLEEGEEPGTRIRDMADRYAEAVAALPACPDLFVGWSPDGLLAFETARRLSGGKTPDLVLVDCSPAPIGKEPKAYDAVRRQVLSEAAAHMERTFSLTRSARSTPTSGPAPAERAVTRALGHPRGVRRRLPTLPSHPVVAGPRL
ncbi:thioesterase domain-containing protein [Streptomyces buecherae]|uniref:thioesterase domain-containing protein n=1 Tax=Streptomyces buecherae TaxID=2763006 RepID=UPI0035588635